MNYFYIKLGHFSNDCFCTRPWGKWLCMRVLLEWFFSSLQPLGSYAHKLCWLSKSDILRAGPLGAHLKSLGAWYEVWTLCSSGRSSRFVKFPLSRELLAEVEVHGKTASQPLLAPSVCLFSHLLKWKTGLASFQVLKNTWKCFHM